MRKVAISGVGYSKVTRAGDPAPERLTLQATNNAMKDAGLTGKDIDGIFQYSFGIDAPNAIYVQKGLGIDNLVIFQDIMGSGPSGLAGAMSAYSAVASGACETAIVYRGITRSAGSTGKISTTPPPPTPGAGGMAAGGIYGVNGLIPTMGMRMRRRIHDFAGATIEDYGQIAVNARKWGSMNDRAVLRDEITMDDYLNSRLLADPLHLLDCDYPVNGACAVVITTAERAADLPTKPVYIDSAAYGTGRNPDWVTADDFLFGGTINAGETLWARSSFTPADVDLLELYDGFTHITISWVEALKMCEIGGFGDWVDGGKTINPGGRVPLNTHGGQLSEGRLHGLAHLAEAVLQLRGDCGPRQVPNAQVAAIGNAHGPQAGAMIVSTEISGS
ncbi:thiolase family protein [Jatrophihabitans sp. DSM 45814]